VFLPSPEDRNRVSVQNIMFSLYLRVPGSGKGYEGSASEY
jgi:hypothetical protein